MDTNAQPQYDRSNYRICRVIARLPSPPRIEPRPEVVYQPLLLRDLAACVLVQAKRPLPPSLPADIELLVDAARKRTSNVTDSCRWDLKDRACPDVTYLRVGNISDHPGFLNRYLPSAFSCPLQQQAQAVLAMLARANSVSDLDTYAFAAIAVRKRYPLFLRLQSERPNEVLVPPIDVQAVWFTHMLQSDAYSPWILKNWPELAGMPHIATRLLSPEQFAQADKATMELWATTDEPWQLAASKHLAFSSQPSIPDINVVQGDRMWYRQFVNSTTGNSDVSKPEFFGRAALGYQRYMYLIAKWSNKIEAYGFAPSPAIDLLWHTHLVQPAAYLADWKRLLGQVHHHKLLRPQERRRIAYYHADFEMNLWKEEFNESFQLYGMELTTFPTPFDERKVYDKPAYPQTVILPDYDDSDL